MSNSNHADCITNMFNSPVDVFHDLKHLIWLLQLLEVVVICEWGGQLFLCLLVCFCPMHIPYNSWPR